MLVKACSRPESHDGGFTVGGVGFLGRREASQISFYSVDFNVRKPSCAATISAPKSRFGKILSAERLADAVIPHGFAYVWGSFFAKVSLANFCSRFDTSRVTHLSKALFFACFGTPFFTSASAQRCCSFFYPLCCLLSSFSNFTHFPFGFGRVGFPEFCKSHFFESCFGKRFMRPLVSITSRRQIVSVWCFCFIILDKRFFSLNASRSVESSKKALYLKILFSVFSNGAVERRSGVSAFFGVPNVVSPSHGDTAFGYSNVLSESYLIGNQIYLPEPAGLCHVI